MDAMKNGTDTVLITARDDCMPSLLDLSIALLCPLLLLLLSLANNKKAKDAGRNVDQQRSYKTWWDGTRDRLEQQAATAMVVTIPALGDRRSTQQPAKDEPRSTPEARKVLAWITNDEAESRNSLIAVLCCFVTRCSCQLKLGLLRQC